jgi:hypothetical protein
MKVWKVWETSTCSVFRSTHTTWKLKQAWCIWRYLKFHSWLSWSVCLPDTYFVRKGEPEEISSCIKSNIGLKDVDTRVSGLFITRMFPPFKVNIRLTFPYLFYWRDIHSRLNILSELRMFREENDDDSCYVDERRVTLCLAIRFQKRESV